MRRLLVKELVHDKRLWLFVMLIFLLPVGLHVYNTYQTDTTFQRVSDFIKEEQRVLDIHTELNKSEKEMNPDFDKDGRLDALIIEAGKTLTAWSIQLYEQNYNFYDKELQLYQHYKDIESLPRFIPLTWQRSDEIAIKQQRAEQMKTYQLAYLPEEYPTLSVYYLKQLSDWLFSGITLIVILLIFGFRIYRAQQAQFDLFLTTPLKRNRIVRSDYWILSLAIGFVVVVFAIIGCGILAYSGWKYINYPILINQYQKFKLLSVGQYIFVRMSIWIALIGGLSCLIQLLSRLIQTAELNFFAVCMGSIAIILFDNQVGLNPFNYLLKLEQQLIEMDYWKLIAVCWLMIGIWQLFSWSAVPRWLQAHLRQQHVMNQTVKVSLLEKLLPKRWRFEYVKRVRQPFVKRILLVVILIVVSSYAFITYRSLHVQEDFRHYLTQQVAYHTEQGEKMKLVVKQIISQGATSFKEEFQARDNQSQTYEEWFSQNYPEDYEGIQSIATKYENDRNYYQAALDKVNAGKMDAKAIIAFREENFPKEVALAQEAQSGVSKAILAAQEQNELIKSQGLTPLLLGNLLLDQYHRYYGDWTEQTQWAHTTYQSLYLMVERHIYLLVLILLFIALSASLSEEQAPGAHIDWLFVIPKKRTYLYWQKLGYNLCVVLGGFLLGMLIFTLISGLLGGLGQAQYPVAVFVPKSVGQDWAIYSEWDKLYFQMIPLIQLLGKVLGLMIAVIIFISSVALMLSVWIRHRLTLMATLSLGCIIGYYLSIHFINHPLVSYLPFIYLNAFSISDGWLAHLADMASYNAMRGSCILIGWALILIVVGWIGFKMKWGRNQI